MPFCMYSSCPYRAFVCFSLFPVCFLKNFPASAVLVQGCAGWWALTRCVQHWMDERNLTLSVSLCSEVHDVWLWGRPEPLHGISGHSWGSGNRVYHWNGKSALYQNVLTRTSAFWRLISLTQIAHYPRPQTHGLSRRNINLDFVFPRLKQNLCILLHVDLVFK